MLNDAKKQNKKNIEKYVALFNFIQGKGKLKRISNASIFTFSLTCFST